MQVSMTVFANDIKFYLVPYIEVSQFLQSKCFFLGPMSSSVVALQTALANPWPANECLAAKIRSFNVWPVAFIVIDKGTK